MLVLSRKCGEEVLLGDDVKVTVVRIAPGNVRLGFEAPRSVSISRPDAKKRAAKPPEEDRGGQSKSIARILLVDDSPEDRHVFRRLLGSTAGLQYELRETDTGEAGLELCRTEQPDCVLLDYMLPDLSGLEFLSELSQSGPRVPVVMLTGHGDELLAVQAMKRGAWDYLPKRDVTPQRLRDAVSNAVAARAAFVG